MKTKIKNKEIHKVFLVRASKEHRGCINCGRKKITAIFYQKKNKQYMCSCLQNISPLSGTPMEKSHVALSIWFGLIKDVATSDTSVGIKTVQEKYHISYVSALSIMGKIKNWINKVEKLEGCKTLSSFDDVREHGIKDYVLKYSQEISPRQLEKKMLDILPPLFNNLRTSVKQAA